VPLALSPISHTDNIVQAVTPSRAKRPPEEDAEADYEEEVRLFPSLHPKQRTNSNQSPSTKRRCEASIRCDEMEGQGQEEADDGDDEGESVEHDDDEMELD
jgi:hypothetical protein